jgi:hypothetical protein
VKQSVEKENLSGSRSGTMPMQQQLKAASNARNSERSTLVTDEWALCENE